MFIVLAILSVVIGYLLGSFSPSFLIARIWGKIDLREEGARHVSAMAVYRRLGWLPFIATVLLDLLKGIPALFIANQLTHSNAVVAVTAVAVAAGHCWSIYIGFYGGLGATVIYGMLLYLAPIELLFSGIAAALVMVLTKRSDLATYFWLSCVTIVLLVQQQELVIALLPLVLMAVQITKKMLTPSPETEYKNNIADDFKRVNKK